MHPSCAGEPELPTTQKWNPNAFEDGDPSRAPHASDEMRTNASPTKEAFNEAFSSEVAQAGDVKDAAPTPSTKPSSEDTNVNNATDAAQEATDAVAPIDHDEFNQAVKNTRKVTFQTLIRAVYLAFLVLGSW